MVVCIYYNLRTLNERAVAPVDPSAILNRGTSPVRLALNVTMMEKSLPKPPVNQKQIVNAPQHIIMLYIYVQLSLLVLNSLLNCRHWKDMGALIP